MDWHIPLKHIFDSTFSVTHPFSHGSLFPPPSSSTILSRRIRKIPCLLPSQAKSPPQLNRIQELVPQNEVSLFKSRGAITRKQMVPRDKKGRARGLLPSRWGHTRPAQGADTLNPRKRGDSGKILF